MHHCDTLAKIKSYIHNEITLEDYNIREDEKKSIFENIQKIDNNFSN
jgi:hypothetical protein